MPQRLAPDLAGAMLRGSGEPDIPRIPYRLPPTNNPFPAPAATPPGRFGESLYGMMLDVANRQANKNFTAWEETPAGAMFKNVYQSKGGAFDSPDMHPDSEDNFVNLLDAMYPRAQAVPEVVDPGFASIARGSGNAFYHPENGKITLENTVPPLQRYAYLAHEREHEAQDQAGLDFSWKHWNDPGYAARRWSSEVPARIAETLARSEADRRTMRRPEWDFTGPDKLPFQPGYQPTLNWAREMARKHGVFDGRSVTELMAKNPAWVRLITGE